MSFLFSLLTPVFACLSLGFILLSEVIFPGFSNAMFYGLFCGMIATVSYLSNKHEESLLPDLMGQSKVLRQEALNAKFAVERAENDRKLKELLNIRNNKEIALDNTISESIYNQAQKEENQTAVMEATENLGDTDMNNTIKLASKLWEPRSSTVNWGISVNKNYKARCRYCNHVISDSNSVAHGAGATCRSKLENDQFLEELEQLETGCLEYLEQPGLFVDQKFEMHLKMVKESFLKYTKWGNDTYLRMCAAALNRLMADKEVAEFVENESGIKGKFWIQAKKIQEKDETALKHYFN